MGTTLLGTLVYGKNTSGHSGLWEERLWALLFMGSTPLGTLVYEKNAYWALQFMGRKPLGILGYGKYTSGHSGLRKGPFSFEEF